MAYRDHCPVNPDGFQALERVLYLAAEESEEEEEQPLWRLSSGGVVRWVSGTKEEGKEAAREVREGSEILGAHGWRKCARSRDL